MVIKCKDCKYCDVGIDDDGQIFYKCLSGYHYGRTTLEDYCSHAELASDSTESYSGYVLMDEVILTIVKALEYYNNGRRIS